MRSGGQPVYIFDRELYESGKGGCALHLTYYIPRSRGITENRFILGLKDRAAHRSVDFAASELAAMVRRELSLIAKGGVCHHRTVVVWIPRRAINRFVYGCDHMERVAKVLAKKLELSSLKLIGRSFFSKEQKSLTSKARRANAEQSMKLLCEPDELQGKTVLLIDDIVTSGSSLSAASRLLLEAGAEQVISVTLALTDKTAKEDFNFIKTEW